MVMRPFDLVLICVVLGLGFMVWGIVRSQRILLVHLGDHCESLAELHELDEIHELCKADAAALA